MAGGSSTPLLGLGSRNYSPRAVFGTISGISIVVLVLLFFIFVEYDTGLDVSDYMWYLHVAVMIWVGFGFLMTFLHRYSLSAVALNYFCSCIIVLETIFVLGAYMYSHDREGRDHLEIRLDVDLLIKSLFAAAAGMITFGVVLGMLSPSQLLLLMILEVPLYAANSYFLIDNEFNKTRDTGGSIGIHTFGTYFGLAASYFLSKGGSGPTSSQQAGGLISMVGTIFLWVLWPSFNAAATTFRYTAIVNTVLSMLGACVTTFFASAVLEGKFNMVHIQNATLAGGVAIGSSADLVGTSPGGALLIGVCAAILSTVGFKYIGPALEKAIKLKDSRGVHNLHGLPGILGAVAAAVVLGAGNCPGSCSGDSKAAGQEILALVVTLAIAILGGLVSGLLVALVGQLEGSSDTVDDGAIFSSEV